MRWIGLLPLAAALAGVALIVESVVHGSTTVRLLLIVPVLSGSSGPFLAGVALLLVGFLLLPLGWLDSARPEPVTGPTAGAGDPVPSGGSGGFVLIGPVPIVFGSWRPISRRGYGWLVVLGVGLTAAALLRFFG